MLYIFITRSAFFKEKKIMQIMEQTEILQDRNPWNPLAVVLWLQCTAISAFWLQTSPAFGLQTSHPTKLLTELGSHCAVSPCPFSSSTPLASHFWERMNWRTFGNWVCNRTRQELTGINHKPKFFCLFFFCLSVDWAQLHCWTTTMETSYGVVDFGAFS